MYYIYIDSGTTFTNYKMKLELIKTKAVIEIQEKINKIQDDEQSKSGITITTSKDGKVQIKGTATSNLYIKITDGIQMYTNVNDIDEYIVNNNPIFVKSEKIKQTVQIIKKELKEGETREINFVNRETGNLASNDGKIYITTNDGIIEKSFIVQKDIYFSYIYINNGTVINDLQLQIDMYKSKYQ